MYRKRGGLNSAVRKQETAYLDETNDFSGRIYFEIRVVNPGSGYYGTVALKLSELSGTETECRDFVFRPLLASSVIQVFPH